MPQGIFIKHRLAFAAGLLMAVMAMIFFLWPAPPEVARPPLPSPNGYDDFVKAGQMLVGDPNNYRY